ncbi:MAG: DUF799 family lipoprotein [Candidatus Hydrogenedentes bacterium]|nr:DUF799 family lipoprotein [Candidatus Hydrogenedentota bacterium]
MRRPRPWMLVVVTLAFSGCATTPKYKDYTAFRTADPRSILIVPVVNRSVDVNAPDFFLSTIVLPVAERGYYTFPVNLVKRVLEDDGLYDANLVHDADPTRLGEIFDADAILYVIIERWDARYMVISTTVTVEFTYVMKSGRTGETIWATSYKTVYQPQGSSSGNPLADLIADALTAAITKAAPNYMPLTRQANQSALTTPHHGLPAGPYNAQYGMDVDKF